MRMQKVYLITENKEKIAIADICFRNVGIDLIPKKLKCPEIQHKDSTKIAAFSAKWAAEKLGVPVIKNDCSLHIDALGGFPGPFVAYVERWIGEDGFLKLMEKKINRKAKYIDSTAFCEPGKKPIVFTSETKGVISKKKEGNFGWGLDKIFIINGDNNIMAMYPDKERIKLFNNNHWKKLANFLRKI